MTTTKRQVMYDEYGNITHMSREVEVKTPIQVLTEFCIGLAIVGLIVVLV
jgi:hypothetical protein